MSRRTFSRTELTALSAWRKDDSLLGYWLGRAQETIDPAGALQAYLGDLRGAHASIDVHCAILSGCLRRAVRDGLLHANPAKGIERPASTDTTSATSAAEKAWTSAEARRFLITAKAAGPQDAT